MTRCYWFQVELDLEYRGLPVRGMVEVDYEYYEPEYDVGFYGSVEVVGVSRYGTPIRRLERWLLRTHGDWLDELASYHWANQDG